MSELSLPLIFNIIIFITLPFIGGILATKFRLPRMIGYILAGVILGIFIKGHSAEFLPIFANVGLILLLFTVGLEMNVDNFKRFGKIVSVIGLLQIFISLGIFFVLNIIIGLAMVEAVIIAFAFALSSTAIVSKVIQDKGEENSLLGGVTLGILILQDIAVIPFMIVLSSLEKNAGPVALLIAIGSSLVRATITLGLIFIVAQKVIPYVFNRVASLGRELLNLLTILFIFIAVFIFSFLGLSPAIAAFVAGLLIGGTLQHYQIFSQIRPLRDIFTILFFVFLGATIDITQIMPHLPLALLFAVLIIAIKFVLISVIFIYFRFHSKTAFGSGILLAQVGEFAFIILHQSQISHLLSQESYLFGITVTLLTIAISPLLMDRRDKLYLSIRKIMKKQIPSLDAFVSQGVDRESAHVDVLSIKDHVILCGYGRVGGYIGRALTMANIPFIAIDYNYQIVEKERKRGTNIIYGDPTDIDILNFAQCETASAIISAVPDAFSQEMIVLNAKMLNTRIKVLSRVGLEKQQRRLKDLGAEVVIQPEFEAALSIIRNILLGYNLSKKDIVGKIKRLKLEHGMV